MPQEEEATVVNEEVVETTTPPESTTEETTEESTSEQTQETEVETPEEESTEETDEKPKKGAEARKEQLQNEISELEEQVQTSNPNQEIRNMVAYRNELRRQVEKANSEAYKPATTEELLEQINPETGDYYSRLEAQVESMRQEQDAERYNREVTDAQYEIAYDVQRVLNDFPVFNPDSPQYDKETSEELAQLLEENLIVDPKTNQVTGTKLPIYKLYKSHARAAQASARKAEIKGQKATETMLSRADNGSGGQAKEKSFGQMNLTEQQAYLRKQGYDV